MKKTSNKVLIILIASFVSMFSISCSNSVDLEDFDDKGSDVIQNSRTSLPSNIPTGLTRGNHSSSSSHSNSSN